MSRRHPYSEDLPIALLPQEAPLAQHDEHGRLIRLHDVPKEVFWKAQPAPLEETQRWLREAKKDPIVFWAARREFDKLYGRFWQQPICLDKRKILVEQGYPELITRFFRWLMSALYSGTPQYHQFMEQYVQNYYIHDSMFHVTKVGRAAREWVDVYVPTPSFPGALRTGVGYVLAFEGEGTATTWIAAPMLSDIWNGGQYNTPEGLRSFLQGDWNSSTAEKLQIDTDFLRGRGLLPEGAKKATWQFVQLVHTAPPSTPNSQPDIAIWTLDVIAADGRQTRLRVHFDARLMHVQREYALQYHLHGLRDENHKLTGYSVCARWAGERPKKEVLQPVAHRRQDQQQ